MIVNRAIVLGARAVSVSLGYPVVVVAVGSDLQSVDARVHPESVGLREPGRAVRGPGHAVRAAGRGPMAGRVEPNVRVDEASGRSVGPGMAVLPASPANLSCYLETVHLAANPDFALTTMGQLTAAKYASCP